MSPYREPPPIEPWTVLDPFPKTVCCDCGAWTTSTCGERRTRCARCDFRHLMRPKRQLSKTVEFLIVLAAVFAFEGALLTAIALLNAYLPHR